MNRLRTLATITLVCALIISTAYQNPAVVFATTCGTGSDVTFTDIGSGQCRGFITSTVATSFTVPTDWSSSNNTLEVIGAGNYAGGGGAYSKITNATLTGGASVGIHVGPGGYGTGDLDSYLCSATTNCGAIGSSSVLVGAKGGANDGTGGSSASGVGTVKYTGGSKGTGSGGRGGGGAAGPNGDGANGGSSSNGSRGGGGGGGGGGTAGGAGAGTSGAGGNNSGGTGGGAGGPDSNPYNGSNGSAGGGGGGGGTNGFTNGNGGNGGTGTEWDATHGSGGGGGGSATTDCCGEAQGAGGNGGTYGGGGGPGQQALGQAGQGIIVLTYTPPAPGRVFRLLGHLRLVGKVRLNGI